MSYRTIIDSVLLRLREDTIGADWTGTLATSSETDDYQKLIGELVNETKDLVEDAWNWSSLRSIETVTTSASTASYDMPNLDDRSRILQVIDSTNNGVLQQISDADFYNFTYIGTPQEEIPSYFRLNDNDIDFWPTPAGVYSIKANVVIPQTDRTLAADTITVPNHLIILGTYALALNERGEDAGTTSDTAGQRFHDALTDAISLDELRTVNETTWYAS